MGMNFKLGLFTEDVYFWVVIAAMVLVAIVTSSSRACETGSDRPRDFLIVTSPTSIGHAESRLLWRRSRPLPAICSRRRVRHRLLVTAAALHFQDSAEPSYSALLGVVALTAFYGGLGPAGLSIAICWTSGLWLLVEPRGELTFETSRAQCGGGSASWLLWSSPGSSSLCVPESDETSSMLIRLAPRSARLSPFSSSPSRSRERSQRRTSRERCHCTQRTSCRQTAWRSASCRARSSRLSTCPGSPQTLAGPSDSSIFNRTRCSRELHERERSSWRSIGDADRVPDSAALLSGDVEAAMALPLRAGSE